jgi:hypothetical protein
MCTSTPLPKLNGFYMVRTYALGLGLGVIIQVLWMLGKKAIRSIRLLILAFLLVLYLEGIKNCQQHIRRCHCQLTRLDGGCYREPGAGCSDRSIHGRFGCMCWYILIQVPGKYNLAGASGSCCRDHCCLFLLIYRRKSIS